MLTISVTYRDGITYLRDVSYDPDEWFREDFKPEWFDDKVVRYIIETIDKNEFISMPTGKGAWKSNWIMNSDVIGYVDPNMLSTGSKSLILIYKTNRIIQNLTLGDNCLPILIELGDMKDIYVEWATLPTPDISNSKSGVKLKETGNVYTDTKEIVRDILTIMGF